MRRRLSLLTALLVLAPLAPSGSASASTAPIIINSVGGVQKGWTTPLEVSVTSTSPVATITVKLHNRHSGDVNQVLTTVTDFQLISGTTTNGVWQSASSEQLLPGDTRLETTVTDTANDSLLSWAGDALNPVEPRFVGVSFAPHTLTVDHQLAVSGHVVYTDQNGVEQPLNGATVLVGTAPSGNGGGLSTNAAGWFSGVIEVDQSATYVAVVGPYDYVPANVYSATFPVSVPVAHTRLTAVLQMQPQQTDQRVRITGRLERQAADGTWMPLGGRLVNCNPECAANPTGGSQLPYVYQDGTFVAYASTPPTGTWTLSYNPGTQAFDPASTQIQLADTAGFKDYSQIVNTASSATRVSPGDVVHVTGQLLGGKTWPPTTPVPNTTVGVYFNPDGSNTGPTFTGKTDANGKFDVAVTVSGPGTWMALFWGDSTHVGAPQQSDSGHIATISTTGFSGPVVVPWVVKKGRPLKISAQLQSNNQDGSGWQMPGRIVTLWFRALGAKTWTRVRTAVTGSDSVVHFTVTSVRSGTWRLSYAGDANHMGSTSPSLYVRVK
jgi:hypothetical protein